MSSFKTMSDVETANRVRGHHWFEPSTMRFFRSRVCGELEGGRFFVSSERFVPSPGAGSPGPRRYTVRAAREDGSVTTVGTFMGHASARQARAEIARLLSMEPVPAE